MGDAGRVRDFYAAVAGWTHEAVDMGGYAGFTMIPVRARDERLAGGSAGKA